MMSFVSFWIDLRQRLFIILASNLFIIIFKVWFRVAMLPPVSYSVYAIEYIDMCLAITMLLLIEFFVIIVISNTNPATPTGNMELDNINMDEESNIRMVKTNPNNNSGCRCFGIYFDQSRIDCVSKFLIPLLFFIFQIFFWIHVASTGGQVLEGLIGQSTHN